MRLGPAIAPALGSRHGFDPRAALWIAEDPGHDAANPNLDPTVAEGLMSGASYTACTFAYPDALDRLCYLLCEPVLKAWVEGELLRGDHDDGGVDPPPAPALPARMAELVRRPAGTPLRALGLLMALPTLDDVAPDATGSRGAGDGRR